MSVLLEASCLSFAYPGQGEVLSEMDFTLAKGEIVGIMGDSGCGKTTFLNCLAGIIPHIYTGDLKGKVLIKGEDVSGVGLSDIARKLGVVFQNPVTQLFSGVVEEDVVFGPENLCLDWQEINDRLESSLSMAGIGEKRFLPPKSLSGGEAQRAALGAVLALCPEILLFDEAMSCLDKAGVESFLACALELKARGRGIVMVEHDACNLRICDRVLCIEGGKLIGGGP